jgi:hypothetical protein
MCIINFSVECTCPHHQEEIWVDKNQFYCQNHTDEEISSNETVVFDARKNPVSKRTWLSALAEYLT